jgi:hypothetical protein
MKQISKESLMAQVPGAAWGRNDLETTEDRYITGGGEAGGSGLPPDLQCPLLADGDITGQANCRVGNSEAVAQPSGA